VRTINSSNVSIVSFEIIEQKKSKNHRDKLKIEYIFVRILKNLNVHITAKALIKIDLELKIDEKRQELGIEYELKKR
jgi:hypothetical protein